MECTRTPGRKMYKLGQSGFTLVELVIIIVVLGILAAVAIPRFAGMAESSKMTATRSEMVAIKKAIVGNADVVAGGQLTDRGFEGDVGTPPGQLSDLVRKPDSIPAWDKFMRLGWNGPYIDSTGGDYLTDAWGATYFYDPESRRLVSTGGSDSIVVSF